jgi:hypothetical protein
MSTGYALTNRKGKPMKKLLLIIAVLVSASTMAMAGSRAERVKELLTQHLGEQGWMLVNEPPLLISFEKRGSVTDNFLMALAFNGTGANDAVYRLNISLTTHRDGLVYQTVYLTLNQQNAFGRSTSIPIKNKRTEQWWVALTQQIHRELPPVKGNQ